MLRHVTKLPFFAVNSHLPTNTTQATEASCGTQSRSFPEIRTESPELAERDLNRTSDAPPHHPDTLLKLRRCWAGAEVLHVTPVSADCTAASR
jgi:hypothetical protein